MNKHLILLCIIWLVTSCNGQESSTYKIGSIPDLEKFEKLTEYEKEFDEKKDKYNAEKTKMMQESNIFRDEVSEKENQQYLEYEKIMSRQKYADNRSRYFLTSYKNEAPDNSAFNDESDILTTECDCYLSDDTIKVEMGFGIFGGFGFPLSITETNFSAAYWEDMHKISVYKKQPSDSIFTESIKMGFDKMELTLAKHPSFSIGESITGYMKLKTEDYYRRENEYDDDMAKIYLKGEIYFKCKVRQKTFKDE